jgi:hypothetical protein
MMTDPSNPSGETARIAELNEKLTEAICRLPLRQDHPDVGKRLKAVSDAQFDLVELLSRLSASPADVGPTRCTCWLSTSSTFGLSEDRERCAVHGDHVQQAADVGPQAQGITAPADLLAGIEAIITDNIEADEGGIDCRVCEVDGQDQHAPECPIQKLIELRDVQMAALSGTVSQAQEKA